MEKIVLGVSGMTCQGCVKKLTGLLKAIPGVEQVDVSLEAGQADIVFDPGKVAAPAFKEVIEGAGFDLL